MEDVKSLSFEQWERIVNIPRKIARMCRDALICADIISADPNLKGDVAASKMRKRKCLQGSVKWEGKEVTAKMWVDLNETAWKTFMVAINDPELLPSIENALSLRGTTVVKLEGLLIRAYHDFWQWQNWLSYEIDHRQQRGDWYCRQFIYPRLCEGSAVVVEEEEEVPDYE